MNCKPIIPTLFILVGVFCASTNDNIESSLKKKTIANAIIFEANLIEINSNSIPEEQLSGVNYGKDSINKLTDTCKLIIGTNANYAIYLENIKYLENNINLTLPKYFQLHVHSPMLVFASEPEIGDKFKFSLFYQINNTDKINFTLLQAIKINQK